MLNRLETKIMDFLFTKCRGKRTVLIPPEEIQAGIAVKGNKPLPQFELTQKQLESCLKNIQLDGYIDYSLTYDKDKKEQLVVSLTTRGEAFQRERDDRIKRGWQSFAWKVFYAAVGAAVAFGVTMLLRAVGK